MVKLGFVGAGQVGASTAFSCLHLIRPESMALVDIQEDFAVGQSLDLAAAAAGLNVFVDMQAGKDYALLEGSDIVVITAGIPRKPGMDRLDLLKKNIGIMQDVVTSTLEHAPGAHLLVVANPVDILTYACWKLAELPRNRVFGMGSWHDSMRLRYILASMGKATDAWMLGEHGESMLVAKSVAGVEKDVQWNEVQDKIRGLAIDIIEKKGATYYAPGVATAKMVQSVVLNEKRVLPTSCILEGEFGIEGCSIGVPAVLGGNGVEGIIDPGLDETDTKNLQASAEKLKKVLADVEL